MKRIILFSDVGNNKNLDQVLQAIFPEEISKKRFLLMPSGGEVNNPKYKKYYDEWKDFCNRNNASFTMVNNSILPQEKEALALEVDKIRHSNILVITGGDPFKLLFHLRRTGLDLEIRKFIEKDDVILAGYSAGAMVLTPTIAITTMEVTNNKGKRVPIHDVRGKIIHPGLNEDLTGLNLVNFEIVPHFEEKYMNDVEKYRKLTNNDVKTCTDDQFFIIEK